MNRYDIKVHLLNFTILSDFLCGMCMFTPYRGVHNFINHYTGKQTFTADDRNWTFYHINHRRKSGKGKVTVLSNRWITIRETGEEVSIEYGSCKQFDRLEWTLQHKYIVCDADYLEGDNINFQKLINNCMNKLNLFLFSYHTSYLSFNPDFHSLHWNFGFVFFF